MIGTFRMDGHDILGRKRKIIQLPIRIHDHQMDVQWNVGHAVQQRNKFRPQAVVVHKLAVHNVNMDVFYMKPLQLTYAFFQAGQIAAADGRGNKLFHMLFHLLSHLNNLFYFIPNCYKMQLFDALIIT